MEVFRLTATFDEPLLVSVGNGVTVQANCYSNGTVSYSWSSSSNVWYLQIEYQCYNNGTTHERTVSLLTYEVWSRKHGLSLLTRPPHWECLCQQWGCDPCRCKPSPMETEGWNQKMNLVNVCINCLYVCLFKVSVAAVNTVLPNWQPSHKLNQSGLGECGAVLQQWTVL